MNDQHTRTPATDISAPPAHLLALETRVMAELPLFLLRTLSIRGLPPGDGHAVMVLPGFGADDLATLPLRRALRRLGYSVYGWGLGRNLGMRSGLKLGMARQLQRLYDRHHGAVSLVGWSLGGTFAREIARHRPDRVRQVFTLGSPINGHPHANNMQTLFRLINRGQPTTVDWDAFNKRRVPPPVPCTAIYTRTDGIVAWRCCVEDAAPNTQNIEVRGSHSGLVFNHQVLAALATHLSTPDKKSG